MLKFKRPAGTSRGVLTEKATYFIKIWDESNPLIFGIGECSPLKGLSIDYSSEEAYEETLARTCKDIDEYIDVLDHRMRMPSLYFGIEMALQDLKNGGKRILFPSSLTEGKYGIPINGLIWMGSIDFMKQQLKTKVDEGFKCIKIKIGSLNFEDELTLLSEIRKAYSEYELEIRLDANGAFTKTEALEKLERLAEFNIHSIEQPIRKGNWKQMKRLCIKSPIAIALDEELIYVDSYERKESLVTQIEPQYLVLKPSLLRGFKYTEEWIKLAEKYKVGWWVTSALESNIGLNAIAQWVATLNNKMPQGLGTGQLYENNIPSPLVVENTKLWYKGNDWDVSQII